MNKDLETKVEERIKDAKERKISFKASEIIFMKGHLTEGLDIDHKYCNQGIFRNKEFEICGYDRWPSDIRDGSYGIRYIFIKYRTTNTEVFAEVNGKIVSYIPDSRWLKEFGELYDSICIKPTNEAARKINEQEEADLRRMFGL